MAIKLHSKWKLLTNPDIVCTIGMKYTYNGVDKYFITWPNHSSRLLPEDVIKLYFAECNDAKV